MDFIVRFLIVWGLLGYFSFSLTPVAISKKEALYKLLLSGPLVWVLFIIYCPYYYWKYKRIE